MPEKHSRVTRTGESRRRRPMTDKHGVPLEGQVAIITGAGRGIGSAIASRLGAMGALAVLCGRTRADLNATAETLRKEGGRAEVIECDVTDLQSVESMAAQVNTALGRIDILVNNAGIG